MSHHEVITPAGTDGTYGVVEFAHLAIGIVAIDEDGATYLVGQHRYPLDEFSWEIPEGGCGKSEQPLECAKRELREEAGLSASSWTLLQTIHLSNSVTDEKGYIYLAEELAACELNREDSEADMHLQRLPFCDVHAKVLASEITDVLSVAAILRVGLERPGLLA